MNKSDKESSKMSEQSIDNLTDTTSVFSSTINNNTMGDIEFLSSTKLDNCEQVKRHDLEQTQIEDLTQIPSTAQDYIKKRKEKVLKFNYDDLMRKHQEMIGHHSQTAVQSQKEIVGNLKFKTRNIESKEAETELDKCITKNDFLRMKVCGQFNKGFIIAQLENDLFIIDQHAADEIYNFETLQKNSRMNKQKLLQPKFLELSASSEAILLDNLK
jgi:DNA mismatch repair ATPase MutL